MGRHWSPGLVLINWQQFSFVDTIGDSLRVHHVPVLLGGRDLFSVGNYVIDAFVFVLLRVKIEDVGNNFPSLALYTKRENFRIDFRTQKKHQVGEQSIICLIFVLSILLFCEIVLRIKLWRKT